MVSDFLFKMKNAKCIFEIGKYKMQNRFLIIQKITSRKFIILCGCVHLL